MATYWKENRTGMIYKYTYGVKPYLADHQWTEVTAWDFEQQQIEMVMRFLTA